MALKYGILPEQGSWNDQDETWRNDVMIYLTVSQEKIETVPEETEDDVFLDFGSIT